jgi:hypothetical protein
LSIGDEELLFLDSNKLRVSSTTELLNENMFDASVSSEGKLTFHCQYKLLLFPPLH